MGSAADVTVMIGPQPSGSPAAARSFRPGQILRLTVLELRGDRAVIDFGTFRSIAEIKVPVSLGDELHVRVLDSGNPLKLGLVGIESKHSADDFSSQARQALSGALPQSQKADLRPILNQFIETAGKELPRQILNALTVLNRYFEGFDARADTIRLATQIQASLENSGLFLESKLANVFSRWLEIQPNQAGPNLALLTEVKSIFAGDLKSNLLILKKFIEDKATATRLAHPQWLTILSKSTNELLTDLARQQARMLQQKDNSSPFQMVTFSLPLSDGRKNAKLRVYYPKKAGVRTKAGYQISLLLSLDRLGDIRTDFSLLGLDLTITFYIPDAFTKKKLEAQGPFIKASLDHLFEQVLVKLVVSKKKIVEFEREDLTADTDKRINLRI